MCRNCMPTLNVNTLCVNILPIRNKEFGQRASTTKYYVAIKKKYILLTIFEPHNDHIAEYKVRRDFV